jgi:hypothetical protein
VPNLVADPGHVIPLRLTRAIHSSDLRFFVFLKFRLFRDCVGCLNTISLSPHHFSVPFVPTRVIRLPLAFACHRDLRPSGRRPYATAQEPSRPRNYFIVGWVQTYPGCFRHTLSALTAWRSLMGKYFLGINGNRSHHVDVSTQCVLQVFIKLRLIMVGRMRPTTLHGSWA